MDKAKKERIINNLTVIGCTAAIFAAGYFMGQTVQYAKFYVGIDRMLEFDSDGELEKGMVTALSKAAKKYKKGSI